MKTESSSPLPSASSSPTRASPNGKRTRDPEEDLYVDNLHFHKRYLSEVPDFLPILSNSHNRSSDSQIMASSLNGLTVGDPLPDNLMESLNRDEMALQYSPMSEDSDDSRFCDAAASSSSQVEVVQASLSKNQKIGGRQRSSEPENRFPSSPSDICHSADLRRAALLRSVQMRAQPHEFADSLSPEVEERAPSEDGHFSLHDFTAN